MSASEPLLLRCKICGRTDLIEGNPDYIGQTVTIGHKCELGHDAWGVEHA